MRRKHRALIALLALPLFACASTQEAGTSTPPPPPSAGPSARPDDAPPTGKLPEGVTPLHYALDLDIDPAKERFSGQVRIQTRVDDERDRIWLHAKGLRVSQAVVTQDGVEIPAAYVIVDAELGLVRLDLTRPVSGDVLLSFTYDAAFDHHLQGLYQVESGGDRYAFTQFESHFARMCFPGFDEPRFKAPFDITVTAKAGDVVVTTTRELERSPTEGGKVRVSYATTEPLPTYLIAFAVGPLDVVEPGPLPANSVRKQPLPFRGVAAKGKGEELKYALAHTGPLLAALEEYFGIPYPFDKLDVIAVPDFASGAMENVGAITFREWLLLVDEDKAPIEQKRAFASVMAHELAHMWFGNLVTMPWWDDIWLNEAFATWMASKAVAKVHPEYEMDTAFVERVQSAMEQDSLVSARQIRQPIESTHDIRNAFDGITYSKGGGVLAMFERWIGEKTFKEGIRLYMDRHRFGGATYEDLVGALSEASSKDVATPFKTFLFQPGLPHVEAELVCEGAPALKLKQSRYLPVGSTGERAQTWQIPVCARYPDGSRVKESCTLLGEAEGLLALETKTCPAWAMPNASGAGYFRFSLPGPQLAALLDKGSAQLEAKERLAIADSLAGAFGAATLPAEDVFGRLPKLAADKHRAVVTGPMSLLSFARAELVSSTERARVEGLAHKLYRPVLARLGLKPKRPDEDGETRQLRARVLSFLALSMNDQAALDKAAALGRAYLGFGKDNQLHPEAVEPSLVGAALAAAVRKDGAPLADALMKLLDDSEDALLRGRVISALASATDPALAARARALVLDPRLRANERLTPLFIQASQPETREDTWTFVQERYDDIVAALPDTHRGALPWATESFCSEEQAQAVEAFLAPRAEKLPGAPRNLASALESIRLCAARVKAHEEGAKRFFGLSVARNR